MYEYNFVKNAHLIDYFFCSPLQLNSHLEKDCVLTEVSCSYAHVGCQAKVKKQLLLNMILILLSVKQWSLNDKELMRQFLSDSSNWTVFKIKQ